MSQPATPIIIDCPCCKKPIWCGAWLQHVDHHAAALLDEQRWEAQRFATTPKAVGG